MRVARTGDTSPTHQRSRTYGSSFLFLGRANEYPHSPPRHKPHSRQRTCSPNILKNRDMRANLSQREKQITAEKNQLSEREISAHQLKSELIAMMARFYRSVVERRVARQLQNESQISVLPGQRLLNCKLKHSERVNALRMDSVRWAPDNGSKCCTLCATAFTVMVCRHHCRFCGNLMCQNCSNDQICNRLSHSAFPERICKVCKVLLAGHFISLLC